MTASLEDSFDPSVISSVLEWLMTAVGGMLPPELAVLSPVIAVMLQLLLGLGGIAPSPSPAAGPGLNPILP